MCSCLIFKPSQGEKSGGNSFGAYCGFSPLHYENSSESKDEEKWGIFYRKFECKKWNRVCTLSTWRPLGFRSACGWRKSVKSEQTSGLCGRWTRQRQLRVFHDCLKLTRTKGNLLPLLQKQFSSLFVLGEPKNLDQVLKTEELVLSRAGAPYCRVQLLQSTASLRDANNKWGNEKMRDANKMRIGKEGLK